MGGRIILHVGAPKTGSTYLQKRLRANTLALRARGLYVPVLPAVSAMAGNAKLLATVLSGEPTLSFRRAFPEMDVALLSPRQVLDHLLQDWDASGEDVILSAENFRPSHAGRLKAMLPKDVEAVVVLFIRRQDAWMESYYNQLIKTRDITCGLGEFVQTLCRTPGERLCRPDWLDHHQAWSAHFDPVHVVCYDAVRDTLFESFLATAGLAPASDLKDVPRAQVAMTTLQLAYLMGLPPDLPFATFLERRTACEEVAREAQASCTSLLDGSALAEIRTRYQSSNVRLLERLGQPELEPLLQPRIRPASESPLLDLQATPAFQRFRAQVEARLGARDVEPALRA